MVKKRIQTAGRAGVLVACFALAALFSRTALHTYIENKIIDSFFHLRTRPKDYKLTILALEK